MSDDMYLNGDPYALSSGLFEGDATIKEAYFRADTGFTQDGSPVTVLELELLTDNPDRPLVTEKFSCGANWEIVDGGARIQRTQGKANFAQTSRAGELVSYAVKAGAVETMRGRGAPTEAATWTGLKFTWERVPVTGKDGSVKERLLPTKYLGAGDGAAANTQTVDESGVLGKLKAAAAQAADFSTFVDAAFAIDGVSGNPAMEKFAMSEDFYTENHG